MRILTPDQGARKVADAQFQSKCCQLLGMAQGDVFSETRLWVVRLDAHGRQNGACGRS